MCFTDVLRVIGSVFCVRGECRPSVCVPYVWRQRVSWPNVYIQQWWVSDWIPNNKRLSRKKTTKTDNLSNKVRQNLSRGSTEAQQADGWRTVSCSCCHARLDLSSLLWRRRQCGSFCLWWPCAFMTVGYRCAFVFLCCLCRLVVWPDSLQFHCPFLVHLNGANSSRNNVLDVCGRVRWNETCCKRYFVTFDWQSKVIRLREGTRKRVHWLGRLIAMDILLCFAGSEQLRSRLNPIVCYKVDRSAPCRPLW